MGTVTKRGANSWRIATQVKVGKEWQWVRMTLRMDPALSESVQQREAEKELKKLEKRMAGEVADTYTLKEWSEIWLTKHLELDASPVTISNYRYLLDSRILPQLGEKPLEDLTPALLTDWLYNLRQQPRKSTRKSDEQLKRPRRPGEKLIPPSKQAKPLSVKTILLYYGCLKTMLAAAVRVGQLEYNPMDRVQHPKKRKKKVTTLSEDDATRLLQLILTEAPQPLKLSVLLAMLCGLRLGEVCALHYYDINRDAETIAITEALKYTPRTGAFTAAPKTEAGERIITLPHSMIQILHDTEWEDIFEYQTITIDVGANVNGAPDPDSMEARGAVEWNSKQWIIHNRYGFQVNKDTPSKWFRKFADAHGFTGITFHDLRHAHASLLVANNIDIAAIAARMGHADPSVTLSVYTHALSAKDQAAAASLDQLLTAALPAADPDPAEDPPADAK